MTLASNSSGFYHTPRVGDEVIISFLDNDIDKPFISGSLYNATNPSLINNPLDSHKTSLSSRTINQSQLSNTLSSSNTRDLNIANIIEDGYNELTLSNIKDNEEIYIRAQKDYKEYIKHNFSQNIQNNKDSIVLGNYTESITKIHKQEVLGLKDVKVGAEYLTNVALSKDTIVGLSHSLNIGASNKLRVAHNSSEYIGGDKSVEVGGNQNITIAKDENRNIKGNKSEVVEGTLDIQSIKEYNLNSEEQINITSQHNILISTQKSIGFESDKNNTQIADNIAMQAKTNIEGLAENQINFAVGNTIITANDRSITLKAGGVEVVIDSSGLTIKGGEIKAE